MCEKLVIFENLCLFWTRRIKLDATFTFLTNISRMESTDNLKEENEDATVCKAVPGEVKRPRMNPEDQLNGTSELNGVVVVQDELPSMFTDGGKGTEHVELIQALGGELKTVQCCIAETVAEIKAEAEAEATEIEAVEVVAAKAEAAVAANNKFKAEMVDAEAARVVAEVAAAAVTEVAAAVVEAEVAADPEVVELMAELQAAAKARAEADAHSVEKDEAQTHCPISGDAFATFWDGASQQWKYKNAVRPDPNGPIYKFAAYVNKTTRCQRDDAPAKDEEKTLEEVETKLEVKSESMFESIVRAVKSWFAATKSEEPDAAAHKAKKQEHVENIMVAVDAFWKARGKQDPTAEFWAAEEALAEKSGDMDEIVRVSAARIWMEECTSTDATTAVENTIARFASAKAVVDAAAYKEMLKETKLDAEADAVMAAVD